MVTSVLSEVLVKDRRISGIRPSPGWAPYFEELLRTIGSRERETGLEPALGKVWNGKQILIGVT